MEAVTYVGHATTLLALGGATVLTDPVFGRWIGPLRRQVPDAAIGSLTRADVVVISHLHRDHLDLRSLRLLPSATPVVVPRGAGSIVSRAGASEVVEVVEGDVVDVPGLRITAVRARHDPSRGPLGPRAAPIGAILASSRKRVYFAGDTELFPEMDSLGRLDLALLPVWGWGPRVGPGHLTPATAATALTRLRPRRAVPIHWGTYYPAGLRRLVARHLERPPFEFARIAAEIAPEIDVEVLRPGERLALDDPGRPGATP